MPEKNFKEENKRPVRFFVVLCLVLVLGLAIVAFAFFGSGIFSDPNPEKTEEATDETLTQDTAEEEEKSPVQTQEKEEEKPSLPKVISTATVGNSGDVLIHNTVLRASFDEGTKAYNFNPSFTLLQPYVSAVDYAVVNAEFSVSADGTYSALPFRVPTTIVEALKNCGYDLGLTANNHIGDGGKAGVIKTINTLKEYGMDYTGSRMTTAEDRYLIKEINGIKIGMVSYTYSGAWNTNGFSNSNLESLYQDAASLISHMRGKGAELIYFYIHWGDEYSLTPNDTQKAISQKLCDLGVDVIVGGHPHKIQPLELIESTDGTHQTICLYSFGNLFSGQQIEHMAGGTKANSPHCYQDSWHFPGCDWPDVADRTKDEHRLEHGPTCNDNGHTEDGLFFTVTASKYEDGTVLITSVDILPTWCMGRGFHPNANPVNSFFDQYTVIPLDKNVDWIGVYGLTEAEKTEAQYSYDRTMALVKEGLEKINASCKTSLENYLKSFENKE